MKKLIYVLRFQWMQNDITTNRTNLFILIKQLIELISEQNELKIHLNRQWTKWAIAHRIRQRTKRTENTKIFDFYIINEDFFMNFCVQFSHHIWYNYFFIINTIIFFYFCNIVSNAFKHFTKFKFTKFIQLHLKIHKIKRCNWFEKRNRNTLNVFQNVYSETTQHF